MPDRLDVAVLGATGSVGQRFVQLLADHPWFRLAELVGSERSAGKRYSDVCDWRISARPPESVLNLPVKHYEEPLQSPIVFSALPGGVAGPIEEALARDGKKVFTNARDHRMDPDVPLLIPEVNPDHARAIEVQRQQRGWREGFIVANPNCSTIHLVLALKPLHDAFGITHGIVTTLQAASGAGYPGVPSLDLIDNVIPFIGGEEEKIERETRKLLGQWDGAKFIDAEVTLSAHCNRVPVRDGHLETVSVKFARHATPSDVAEVLASFRAQPQELGLPTAPKQPVVVLDLPDRPQPVLDRDIEGGMASVVGRIRPCSVLDVRFVVLGHNTIRGAAGASVLNAELFYRQGLL
ncbi:aspartate-semialdehyde dehydrogenase [Thermorudis peleae]|uniref:aspartate-semialdehyde dehydrogenase n=1 Tax=Thermorudis peleae TaxID=1382356 RepID=UPI0005709B74|nr:aspartate-semialdehyde dehydrogenase [Thermorudis peleae]MBX6753777.1 aspartate-semialdehyde dehydrogenase [Thermorudis peleae]